MLSLQTLLDAHHRIRPYIHRTPCLTNQTIDRITLRKPRSGELRGVSLSDLVSLDVIALSKVLPRISTPTLTEADVAGLDPADLVQIGGLFAGFLMPRAVKAKLESQTA